MQQAFQMMPLALPLLFCLALQTAQASGVPHDSPQSSGKTVHVVFGNHLDIGFDGIDPQLGTDDNVINRYFDEYFPRAISTAKALKDAGKGESYIWTTHSWLVSMYLSCPLGMGLHCPTMDARREVENAIRAGVITWHAFPHNAQLEFMDTDMVEFGIDMTHELDRNFGLPLKLTLSQRDVPGLTRAAVPVLANPGWQRGLKGVSVGVNGGSAPPDVPTGPFLWRDEASGYQLIAMWHKGGYSGRPVDGPECMQAEGFDHVMCCAWRGDNAGPHSPEEVRDIVHRTREAFPGATVQASTFDAFVVPLAAATDKGLKLPVFTGEIGDTWMHGVASDAAKTADYRALQRMRRKLVYDQSQDPAFRNFSRLLIKVPEHTWGADVKKAMPDYRNWSNADFGSALHAGRYKDVLLSWQRQRLYLDWALQALGHLPGASDKQRLMSELQPPMNVPDVRRLQYQALRRGKVLRSDAWDVKLNPRTGAISGLRRRWTKKRGGNWAGRHSPLGQLTYSTYTEADFDAIWRRYAYQSSLQDWFYKDFGKPNCSRWANTQRADSVAQVRAASFRRIDSPGSEGSGFHAAVRLAFPEWTVREAGAPAEAWLEYTSLPHGDNLYVDFTWVNKTASRLSEALWVDWQPSLRHANASSWTMRKLGSEISPLEVVRNGSRSLHGVADEGFSVRGQGSGSWERLNIRSLDVALVSPGRPTPFPNPAQQPDLRHGMHSLVADNIWGTNYVMWQPWRPEDSVRRFRFVLQMEDVEAHIRGPATVLLDLERAPHDEAVAASS